MTQKAADSAIQIIRRGYAAISHNLREGKRRFPPKPKVDFSSVRHLNDALGLFREMMTMSPRPSVRVYNKLLSVVAKMEEYTVALSLFDRMRQSSILMNEFTMNIIINCCCHLNRVDIGFSVLGNFLKQDYKPDVTTFNTLLKGLFLVGKVDKAGALFSKFLVYKLCEPDDVMFLTMIDGLCKSGQAIAARNLLREFENASHKPHVKAYNALIDGLCNNDMVDGALHLLPEMSDKGIRPDAITYNAIIHGLCKDGRVDDALRLLSEMPSKGVQPNAITYNTIIHGLCKDGRVDDALHLLSEMPNKGVQPDAFTYNTIIHGLCSFSRWNEVMYFLLVDMVDHSVPLDVVSFSTLIDMHCKEGKMMEAESILELMLKMNVCPDIITYNTMIEGYCKSGNVDEAWRLFQEIPRKGLKRETVSYSTMMHGLFGEGRFVEGRKLFKDMEARHIPPDLHTYNILINALCKVGKIDDARDLVNQLPSKGLQPDVQTYTTLIGSLYKEGLDEEAKCLLTEMEKNGIAPDNVMYKMVLHLLKRKEAYGVIPFLKKMYKRGSVAHSADVSMLLDIVTKGKGMDMNLLEENSGN